MEDADEQADYDIPVAPDHLARTVHQAAPYRAHRPTGELGEPYNPVSPRTLRPTSGPRAWADYHWTLAGGGFWDWDNQARIEGPGGRIQRLRDQRASERADAQVIARYVRRHAAELRPLLLRIHSLYFGQGYRRPAVAAMVGRPVAVVVDAVKELRIRAGLDGGVRRLHPSARTAPAAQLHVSTPLRPVGVMRLAR